MVTLIKINIAMNFGHPNIHRENLKRILVTRVECYLMEKQVVIVWQTQELIIFEVT